jgi:hypothetical protein
MRNQMSSKAKKVAIGASLVLGSLGIGGAGFALVGAGTASAAATPSTGTAKPDATKGQDLRKFLRRHTVDATVTVKTKDGYETLSLARGTVGAISTTSITVDPVSGPPLTGSITDQTKFHNTTEAELAPGDKVGLLVDDGVARLVNAPKTTTPAPTS